MVGALQSRPRVWICLAIFLATGVVYLNSFPGAFHFDDFPLLLENPDVISPQFRYLSFLDHYGGRPLTLWSFHLNHRFAGQNPFSYHLINVMLHALTAAVLFLLVLDVFRDRAWAAVTALLFAFHPLQTQAVNYVWSRSAVLSALFGLTALWLFRKRPWLALALFQVAIWSRAEALVLLPLLIWRLPSKWRLAAGVAAVNLAGIMWGLASHAPAEVGWRHSDPVGYWISQPAAFWKYLRLLAWPFGQTIDHDFRIVDWGVGLASLGAAAALFALAWRIRARSPVPLYALAWTALFLIPSALVPNTDLFNESRAYLAAGGFSLAAGWGLLRLTASRDWSIRALPAVLALMFLTALTVSRNQLWNDDLLIWREAAQRSPLKSRVRYNLGFALAQRGLNESAEAEFRRARDLNPEDDLSYAALGYCAEVRREWREAVDLYGKALQLNPYNDYARRGAARVGGPNGARPESVGTRMNRPAILPD